MANKQDTDPEKMEKIVSLCKSKGFIMQSAEIYGGLNGCWDYGPLGAELKKNVKEYWWRKNVQERDDVLGMDGSILTHREVLTYHYAGASHEESGWSVEREFSVLITDANHNENNARKTAKQYYSQFLNDKTISPKKLALTGESTSEEKDTIRYNPENGSLLTEPRDFNLMFQTKMGASSDDNDPNAVAYLRPETAQTIFVQYKNVLDASRVKLPFGIAQIGKAFRNEINPRNFTFRSREFEQMEIEYFCRPEDGLAFTEEWLKKRLAFYDEIGVPSSKIHVLDVPDGERAHYSSKTYDLEYEFPFGIQELEGVAYRGDYDISKHAEHSKKNLEYIDTETKERFIPHVVEPSAGCDRTCLAVLCEAYVEENLAAEGEKPDVRKVMRFKPVIAPIKVAILPLLKNKPELVDKAKEVKNLLQPFMNVFYDETAAIGRRYRRQDEVGTPFCVAIDFETLGEEEGKEDLKDTVTVRHRDSMKQERVAIADLLPWVLERIR